MSEEKRSLPAAALRAVVIKASEREPGSIPDPFDTLYKSNEVIEPPLPFSDLKTLVDQSNILPQCIEAMARNISGYGHAIKCEVPDDEREAIEGAIREEYDMLQAFWMYCATDRSLISLRYDTRWDLETYANAWWEVSRKNDGTIAGFNYLPAATMRAGANATRLEVPIKRMFPDTWDYSEEKDWRTFRTYVQIVGTTKVWFKEFGDPRTLDRTTGKVVSNDDEATQTKAGNKDAREVIHFKIGPSSGVYGQPRWIGNLLSAAGSRSAEEVNWFTFEDQGLGRMVVMVKGGELTEGVMSKMREFVADRKKRGTEGFHKILLLEAISSGSTGPIDGTHVPAEIEIKELGGIGESLFKEYDKDNRNKLRSSFRLPPLYVGETTDYTRATAKESKEIAEEQVFGPERTDEDEYINRMILPELDAVYHSFVTRGAATTSDEDRVKIMEGASKAGLPLVHVIGKLAEILDVKYDKEKLEAQEWAQKPLAMARGSATTNIGDEPEPGKEDENLEMIAAVMKDLRSAATNDGKPKNWIGRLLKR